jgi:hypothetical protein
MGTGPDLPPSGGNYRFGGDATHRSGFRLKDPNPATLAYESKNTSKNSKERNSIRSDNHRCMIKHSKLGSQKLITAVVQ